MTKASEDVILSHLRTKKHDYMTNTTDIFFCHFRPFFALLPHHWTRKLKFRKNVKYTWKYYPFTHVHHKWRYDVWFLRYKVQRTEFFVIFGHFLSFDPPNNPKNQDFEKTKKKGVEISFYTCRPQMTIIWCMFIDISSATDIIICHFGLLFCPFTTLTTGKIKKKKKKKKNKKDLGIS